MEHWLEREIAQWVHHHEGSIRWPIAPRVNALTTELHLAPNHERMLYHWATSRSCFEKKHDRQGWIQTVRQALYVWVTGYPHLYIKSTIIQMLINHYMLLHRKIWAKTGDANNRKEALYLMMHQTYFIYSYMMLGIWLTIQIMRENALTPFHGE